MTRITQPNPREMVKWRQNANKAAHALKQFPPATKELLLGFVFDDAVVKVPVMGAEITERSEKELADLLYDRVLTIAQTGGSA